VNVSRAEAIRYGLPGFALAFAALPLYLLTPALYAEQAGLNLAAVGLVLMATRLIDAITDPFIGRMIDRSHLGYWPWVTGGLMVMAIALSLLVNPPLAWLNGLESPQTMTLLWMGVAALTVSLANSFAMLAHQGWAVAWTAQPTQQTRLIASREMWALIGVILAASIAAQRSGPAMAIILILFAVAGVIAIRPLAAIGRKTRLELSATVLPAWRHVFQIQRFRRLVIAYGLNALANSVPATLVLFFIQDVLSLSSTTAGALLALYFVCAAAGVPIWTKLSVRLGVVQAWRAAMLIATAAFIWALTIGQGDVLAFAVICVATGFALGAELVCPPVLLGQAIDQAGHRGQLEASYFGVWNLTAKIALAAAAGLALPVLAWLNYLPGVSGVSAQSNVDALQWAYAGLPCALKLLAIAALTWATLKSQSAKEEK
jgi:glycoside/pentoside/hexuronide:cation symporter, GPH family